MPTIYEASAHAHQTSTLFSGKREVFDNRMRASIKSENVPETGIANGVFDEYISYERVFVWERWRYFCTQAI